MEYGANLSELSKLSRLGHYRVSGTSFNRFYLGRERREPVLFFLRQNFQIKNKIQRGNLEKKNKLGTMKNGECGRLSRGAFI